MKALESQIKSSIKLLKPRNGTLAKRIDIHSGIGPVYSAGIMAEIGDINRFNSRAALAKYAGLAWKQHSPVASSPKLHGSFHPATDF